MILALLCYKINIAFNQEVLVKIVHQNNNNISNIKIILIK